MRSEERVTPLELFFDLVFVLAITQCTALMAANPTRAGLGKGLLVLALLWWGWVGYAWLTSVVDPEEGLVRLIIFAAMAAMLVAALCVPTAFAGSAGIFAGAYAIVRGAHIGLFVLAIVLDSGGPYFFGTEGWKLVPHHFAERHGLIILIALGESIVALGA